MSGRDHRFLAILASTRANPHIEDQSFFVARRSVCFGDLVLRARRWRTRIHVFGKLTEILEELRELQKERMLGEVDRAVGVECVVEFWRGKWMLRAPGHPLQKVLPRDDFLTPSTIRVCPAELYRHDPAWPGHGVGAEILDGAPFR